MARTPVAAFTYNRPEHTHQMLDSLAKCARLDECEVVIFSDAPRTLAHAGAVEETRRVIQSWAKQHPASIVERSENWGLARSITSGVSELCEQFGRVIVIEDDLVLHPAFLHFMLSALDRYADDEQVAQVAGYMFPVQHVRKPDAFFLPYITSWGWGTWARAWKLFRENPDISALNDPALLFRFNHNGVTNHAKMLQDRLEGRNQSWAVLFYWQVFIRDKLVLYPRLSYVRNIGFDGTGVHFNKKVSYRQKLLLQYENWLSNRMFRRQNSAKDSEFIWPQDVAVDQDAYSRITSYRKSRAHSFIQFLQKTLFLKPEI